MKLFQWLFLLTSAFLFQTSTLASEEKNPDKPDQIPDFPIYVEANKDSKIIEKANISTPLIKIFKKDNWIKVGNQNNGDVGWIQEEAYKKALEATYFAKNQVISINVHEKGDQNSNHAKIIAYKNGKKLDEKEAKALYEQLKREQAKRDQAMGEWMRSLNYFFNQHTEALMAPYFLDHTHPVVLIEQAPEKRNEKKTIRTPGQPPHP